MLTYYKRNDSRLRFNFAEKSTAKQNAYYLQHPQILVSKLFSSFMAKENPTQIIGAVYEIKDKNLIGLKDWFAYKQDFEEKGYQWSFGFIDNNDPESEAILLARRHINGDINTFQKTRNESKVEIVENNEEYDYIEELQFVCTVVKALQKQDAGLLKITASETITEGTQINTQTTTNSQPSKDIRNVEQLVKAIKNLANNNNDSNFTGDYNSIDVSQVTDMSGLFSDKYGLGKFNGDISKWKTSNVTNMSSLFLHNHDFNKDISQWDTSNVINFNGAFADSIFNNDISNWDVSNAQQTICMFLANKNFNQDISQWDVLNITNAYCMFADTKEMQQDLSDWKLNNECNVFGMFYKAPYYQSNSDKLSDKLPQNITEYQKKRICSISPKIKEYIYKHLDVDLN